MSDAEQTPAPPEDLYRFDRTVNKRVTTLEDINEADLGFFQEHGYLVVDEFLTSDEVTAAKAGMVRLLKSGQSDLFQFEPGFGPEDVDELDDPDAALNYIRKFMWFAEHDADLRAPAERADLLDLVSVLVDGTPERFQDMALIKPPGGGVEKPWHQDKAYFDLSLDAPVVGVWIALDEATAANGCMHIIPGSHRDGPMVHFDRRDWQICDTDVQANEDVMVPLSPGGMLLFDGLLHHGTPPNTSSSRRRALQFHYTAANAEWLEQRPTEFGNQDKDVTC